jgi:hypothetical protein
MSAYSGAKLLEKLKGKGLDIAEDAAKVVAEAMFEWLDESAKESANPYDNVVMELLSNAKEPILKQIDKIDGQVG